MPSVVVGPKKTTSILNRSESLRSEISDASLQSKKVSFNNDVRIRRIPRGGIVHGQIVAVLEPSRVRPSPSGTTSSFTSTGCLWISSSLTSQLNSQQVHKNLLTEAETILKNVNNIQCRTTPSIESSLPSSKVGKRLERSKSELIPNGVIQRIKNERLKNGDTSSEISEFLDVSGKPLNYYSKVSRIKKPSRRRAGLDNLGDSNSGGSSSSSSSSGSDNNNKSKDRNHNSKQQLEVKLISESPLSSLSSDTHDNNMSSMTPQYATNPRVSSLVTKLGSMRREHQGPLLHSSFVESGYIGTTHNNNQPFSYIESSSSGKTSEKFTNGHSNKKGREIIYAQVVSGEKKDGTPEKRTIHKKFSDLTTTSPSDSPDYQKHIRHFVYDKENWKNNPNGNGSDSSALLSTYKTRNGSQYGSKNNVTTVLLNSNDEEDSLRSTTIHNNDLFITNPRSSSSPPRLTERPFFYGDSRHAKIKSFDHHSSSSSPQFQYSSSSREHSPAGIAAAKLVRDVENRKAAAVVPSAKLVSNFVPNLNNHTDYQYMTNKLGYLSPSEYSIEVPRPHPQPSLQSDRSVSIERKPAKYEVKTNGWSKTGTSRSTLSDSDYKRTNNITYSKNNNNNFKSFDETLEKNQKNQNESETMKKKTIVQQNGSSSKPPVSSGGGLISTLMRRNKDKKLANKEKKVSGQSSNDPKVKQRNKFLSLFFDKNTTNKKSNNNKLITHKTPNKSKTVVTDSEIDDAERKRDGEYHSWSSVDGSYRLLDKNDQRSHDKVSRGKSYNSGDYRKTSVERRYDNGDHDSEDYRRDLATTGYKSVTLGRPIIRSSMERVNEDSMESRTKSLDRRNIRTNNRYESSPPKIIITPNSPPVDESGYNWGSNYQSDSKQKLGQKLSKSSMELDSSRYSQQYRNDHRDTSPLVSKGSEKLRYFGETDAESLANHQTHRQRSSSRFNSPARSSKIDQNYGVQNDNHISRRDTLLRKIGRHDGLNSSEESESRFSKGSSTNIGSMGSRSVFLHAPTVAEIPPPMGLQRRTLSKDEISNYSGPQRQTRHLARSMSVLAPWRPRNYREKYEVHYDEDGNKEAKYRRPPKPPRSPNRKSVSPVPPKRHSETSENFSDEKYGQKEKQMNKISTSGKNGPVKRSKSIPNDSSFPGWLSRSKETNKK